MKSAWKYFLHISFTINCCIYCIYISKFLNYSIHDGQVEQPHVPDAGSDESTEIVFERGNKDVAYKKTLRANIAATKEISEAVKWWRSNIINCTNDTLAASIFNINYEHWLEEKRSKPWDGVVPNLVHYLWYSKETKDIDFTQLLSILSAHVNCKPRTIYYHTNCTPAGPMWDLVRGLPELRVVHRQPSSCIFGEKLRHNKDIQLQSDVDRLTILLEYGGIYADTDVLFVRDFNAFRSFPFTLGMQYPKRANNAVIISSRYSVFLLMWLNSFIDNFSHVWAENSGLLSLELAKRFPHLVRIHWGYFYKPDLKTLDRLYGDVIYDWWNNYFIHLWKSNAGSSLNVTAEDVVNSSSTFGQLATCILYKARHIVQNFLRAVDLNQYEQVCIH